MSPRMVPERLAWLADRAPMWMRSRWPLKRFYWQQDEIDEMWRKGREMARIFGLEEER